MVAVRSSTGLSDDLEALAFALEGLDLRTAEVRGRPLAPKRDQLVRNIRSYLLPKLVDPEMPLCVVFAGPTGSGKSTLINTISGFELSETGPIRPTTTAAIVLVSEGHQDRFTSIGPLECETVLGRAPILEGMALVDTPDIDSTSTHHRGIAEALIDYADVVVFVTSTLRYADNVPWEVLRRASSRGATLINVLNRYGSDSSGAYVDFQAQLAAAGIDTEVLRIPEHHVGPSAHAVPSLAVRELSRRLVAVGRDRQTYSQGVLNRVLGSTIEQTRELASQLRDDRGWLEAREESIRRRFDGRAAWVDLSEAASHIDLGFPEDGSARRKRRWLKRGVASLEFSNSVVVSVDSHIRVLGYAGGELAPMIRTALASWTDYVRRVAREASLEHIELGTAALMKASLDSEAAGAVLFLYDDQALVLVERAQKELVERLQVVYNHAAERLVEVFRNEAGDPDASVVSDRLSSVVARSHFADA